MGGEAWQSSAPAQLMCGDEKTMLCQTGRWIRLWPLGQKQTIHQYTGLYPMEWASLSEVHPNTDSVVWVHVVGEISSGVGRELMKVLRRIEREDRQLRMAGA